MIKNLDELKLLSEKAKKDLELRLKGSHTFEAEHDENFLKKNNEGKEN